MGVAVAAGGAVLETVVPVLVNPEPTIV